MKAFHNEYKTNDFYIYTIKKETTTSQSIARAQMSFDKSLE